MTITITHLSGPLKGEKQTFDDRDNTVVFGRSHDADVVYPQTYDVVGRRHFELHCTKIGDYTVELFGSHYVEIDGQPADNGMPVKSGSTIRLGRKDGPMCTVEIGKDEKKDVGLPMAANHIVAGAPILLAIVALVGVLGVGLIGAGVWLVYLGATGSTEIQLFGNSFKSQNVGVVGVFCGAVLAATGIRRTLAALEKLGAL